MQLSSMGKPHLGNNNRLLHKSRRSSMSEGQSWAWSYASCIYNYLCNQCLSPLTLWHPIPLRWGDLDTTLCDKLCQWLAAGWFFFPVSSTNKTDHHDITEILLKVALNTITQTLHEFEKFHLFSEWSRAQQMYNFSCE